MQQCRPPITPPDQPAPFGIAWSAFKTKCCGASYFDCANAEPIQYEPALSHPQVSKSGPLQCTQMTRVMRVRDLEMDVAKKPYEDTRLAKYL